MDVEIGAQTCAHRSGFNNMTWRTVEPSVEYRSGSQLRPTSARMIVFQGPGRLKAPPTPGTSCQLSPRSSLPHPCSRKRSILYWSKTFTEYDPRTDAGTP